MNRDPHDNRPYAPPYRHIAGLYDAISSAYSLGAIDRAKRLHHRLIEPGMRVMYAGAGRGREIVEACRLGAEAVCVEPCPAMARRLHRRLSASADGFTLVPRPIQEVPAEPVHDLVVAHFFLNLFDARDMPVMLAQLCGFVRPGGRLVIADFKPAVFGSGAWDRTARALYYGPPHRVGRLLGMCQPHPIYDYAPGLIEQGFTIESRDAFGVLPGLPAFYEVITARQ